ncbi:MAG: phosphohistidine phosphatase SixA [Cyclobacteriaceae bacterium]|nr:phosphohistidine phosphatase SixA [Cyclobacteriaceae bacterium]
MAHKHLYLLRHAHALERQGNESDFERNLSPTGLQNSTRMGINLLKKEVSFDMIVSSPAERAKNTAELVAEQIKYNTDSIYMNNTIYEASPRNLLQVVNNLKPEWKSVLMVGHNPAISYLAEYLTGSEIGNMTTCGLAYIKFENMKWEDILEYSGKLISYEYPDLLNF